MFATMGTVASLDVPAFVGTPRLMHTIRTGFAAADQRFSLYKADSELSAIADGRLSLLDASDELRASYALAIEWQLSTTGAFTPHRPDGVIDLNGVVKALAIAEAGATLCAAGIADWSINVGGDVVCSGLAPDSGRWTTGIIDPSDRESLLCAVTMSDRRAALATSGSTERGDHIWTRDPTRPTEFVQVSVLAADIVTADVLATAIIAGGRDTLDRSTVSHDIDVLAVDASGALTATPGFRTLLAAAAA